MVLSTRGRKLRARPMNVLFIFFQFLPQIDGTTLTMYQYAKELVRRGHSVTVFTANALAFRHGLLKKQEVLDDIAIRRFPFLPVPFYDSFFFCPSLVPSLVETDPDVVMIFSWLPSFFLVAPMIISKARNIPLVLCAQSYPGRALLNRGYLKRLVGVVWDQCIGLILMKRFNHIIALTEKEASFYRAKGLRNVTVIREPISLDKTPSPEELARFKRKFHLSPTDDILLAVGRITRHKGFDILIKALPYVMRIVPHVKLLIAGADMGFKIKCIDAARVCGCEDRVIFAGSITDEELASAYCVASAVVIPSFFEGYGRTLLEAWAYGKPLVTSNTVGLSEVVSDETGFQVEPGDPVALAHAISRILTDRDLATSMGRRGHDLFLKEFAPEIAFHKLEKILTHVTSNNDPQWQWEVTN